jgi:hypothetical protein
MMKITAYIFGGWVATCATCHRQASPFKVQRLIPLALAWSPQIIVNEGFPSNDVHVMF